MKYNKAILLFEVAVVVLLVSVFSLFLFRGYSLFVKAGRRSLDYLKLVLVSEERIWDLQEKERNNEITEDMETGGAINSHFTWRLTLEDTGYDNFKKGILTVNSEERRSALDTVIYLSTKEE